MTEYSDYNLYPKIHWRWPDFTPREMRSKGDDRLMINQDAMDKLQALRTMLGKPMKLTSAYRSVAHNKSVGGARNSMHLQARAFDVQMEGHDPAGFEAAARAVGFTGFGFYEKSGFIHIDTGPAREWRKRWFVPQSPTKTATARVRAKNGGLWAALVAIFIAIAKIFRIRQ